eukprot:gnl/TRDRNA2_/TRDRNA2_200426_c0_seq1.p1 gnl/TRDRNA2_/TRDRNA2_200426_c0~~gnl/TRDRNA2_/TRDRNA2_200426_c0_seq1.p1  ORF type:complete len:244 (+),score=17.41 gnl/TRDRNA2_/TRDRNA2_200426_c0_seq1:125-856(+)
MFRVSAIVVALVVVAQICPVKPTVHSIALVQNRLADRLLHARRVPSAILDGSILGKLNVTELNTTELYVAANATYNITGVLQPDGTVKLHSRGQKRGDGVRVHHLVEGTRVEIYPDERDTLFYPEPDGRPHVNFPPPVRILRDKREDGARVYTLPDGSEQLIWEDLSEDFIPAEIVKARPVFDQFAFLLEDAPRRAKIMNDQKLLGRYEAIYFGGIDQDVPEDFVFRPKGKKDKRKYGKDGMR